MEDTQTALEATRQHWFFVMNHCQLFLDSVNSHYDQVPRRNINNLREKITAFQINSVNLRGKLKGFRILNPFHKSQSPFKKSAGLTMKPNEELSLMSWGETDSQKELYKRQQRKAMERDHTQASKLLYRAMREDSNPQIRGHLDSLLDLLAEMSAEFKSKPP